MRIRIDEIVIPEERARSRWSEEQKAMLEGAVKEYGQLSDPLVRELPDGRYELLDGESRIREFIANGIEECDVKVVKLNDKDASLVNVLMNIARGEQDPMGIALAFKKAMEEGHTEEKIAQATGHTREWVHFHVALNELPEIYQEALQTGELRVGHIKQAFRLPTIQEQAACLNLAITQGLRVTIIENYVDNILAEYAATEILQSYMSDIPQTPQVDRQRLIHTTRCLSCNEAKPSEEITHPVICEGCYALIRVIAPIIGSGEEGLARFNEMVNLYREYLKAQQEQVRQPTPPPAMVPSAFPQPAAVPPSQPNSGTLTKPEGMPQEEWERLTEAIRTRFQG